MAKYRRDPPKDESQLIERSFEAASLYEPLICVALAGVESGKEQFRHQTSIIDEMLYLKNWERSGYTAYVSINRGIVFLYQALHGALSLQTDQISLAYDLITAPVEISNGGKTLPIWKNHDLVGLSYPFGHKATVSWNVLLSMPKQWHWLESIFGNSDEYVASLNAYYLFLNFIEYLSIFSSKQEQILSSTDVTLEIPVCCLRAEANVQRKAYSQLIRNKPYLLELIRTLNLDTDCLRTSWKKWVSICRNWILQVYQFPVFHESLYSNLITDLF